VNFEVEYTAEQQRFREEVRSFLEEHVSDILRRSDVQDGFSFEHYQAQRALGRKLGERGWLFPAAPRQYGGGGLDFDHTVVILEELDRFELTLPPYYDSGGTLGSASILVWGSEEQKRHFLPPIYRGEVRTWQLLTEPGAGSDVASVQTKAIRDGDDYVVTGQKVFVGSDYGAERLWTLAVTDPTAPRHQNLSWFMIDAELPGISVQPMELLTRSDAGGVKNSVFFDAVRVPAFCLVGGENRGWDVASTHLELEHGGGGTIRSDKLLPRLMSYARSASLDGAAIAADLDARTQLVDYFIDSEIHRLFGMRNYYLAHANKPRAYEGPQLNSFRKQSQVRRAETILKALGYYALTTDPSYIAAQGHLELHQRSAIVGTHPGGTIEILKLVMARRLGLGRNTREEAGQITRE